MTTTTQITLSILFCSLTFYLFQIIHRWRYIRYPPGPRGIPLLGNALQLGTVKPWHTLAKWKKDYGPIVYLNMAGQPFVILNTKKVVEDLLDRRSTKYSGRPNFIVGNEITGDLDFAMLSGGERWRKMRRASENALGLKNLVKYYELQRNEAIFSSHSLLSDPDSWRSQMERTSSSTALAMIYDLPLIQSTQDPSIQWMNSFNDKLAAALMPGAYLVDAFPSLRHLPRSLSRWRQYAEETFELYNSGFEQMFQKIKNQVTNGQEQRPSFCVSLAENQGNNKLSDQECSWLAGTVYSAAHETTASTLMWFIFSMVLFPKIQTRAQEELDNVVGRSRLPSFADLKHLPYIHAIVREVLRWRTPLPIGLPHVATEDDFYDGYYIPKGTTCIANVWSLNHDPDIFGPDAKEFRPERHLDKNGQLKDEILGSPDGHFTYGFGQRICVGRHVANNSLFIAMATILWTVRLEAAKDSNGKLLVPDVDAEEEKGVVVRPPTFAITTTPRFRDADAFIQEARDQVMEEIMARQDACD